MDEPNRRKSTSSESELSDGWNLVDAVEVMPVETSDAESVEVINGEQSDSDKNEFESGERENETSNKIVLESAVTPTDNGRLLQEELLHIEPVGNTHYNLKELLEALVVFIVIAILALSSSYFLLAVEETLMSVKPLIWGAVTPSSLRTSIDIDKMKEELNAYKQENLRLANELKKFKQGSTSTDKSNEISGETSDIYLNFFTDQGPQNKKLIDNEGLDNESPIAMNNDFSQTSHDPDIYDLKPQLNILSAVETTLLTIQTITKNSSATEMQRNITQSINSIIEDLEVLNIISSNGKFKNFSEKWYNNMNNVVQNIQSDVFHIVHKINRHVSKKINKVHISFLKKLCHKLDELSPQSEPMEVGVEEICVKYIASLSHIEGQAFKEKRKNRKDVSDSPQIKDNGNKKYKKKSQEIQRDYEIHKSGNLKENKDSYSDRPKKGIVATAVGEDVAPSENSNNPFQAQLEREEKRKRKQGNKDSVELTSNKKNKNYNTPVKLGYSKNDQVKESSKSKAKQLVEDRNDNLGKDSKIDGPTTITNLQKNDLTCFSGDHCSRKEVEEHESILSKGVNGKEEDTNKYGALSDYDESVLPSKKKSTYLADKLNDSGKDTLKKKTRSEQRYKTSKMVRRSYEQRSKHNSSSSGSWFSKLGDARANIRTQHQKSEWMFERARGRDKQRDETRWVFDRAWARQRCRENPKSVWCNWQENLSNSFDSNSYNVFR